ncbi:MAG: hypothetical protein CMO80_02965 [Verrucomicrobiales bacterium]|nr:hypothetical protein [Verrucomicrobiales bacterium]
MLDLFKSEVENQKQLMTSSLLALEENPTDDGVLASRMRAEHSIKGAGRIVDLDVASAWPMPWRTASKRLANRQ